MKKLSIFYLWMCLFYLPLQAQFNGGNGDGSDSRIATQALNGSNITTLYSGGQGDGFVTSAGSFALNGTNITALYNGGNGDGFDKNQYGGSLNDIGVSIIYNGGNGDGFDFKQYGGSLNGMGVIALFNGGIGDGFDKFSFSGSLSGILSDVYLSGGDGDGFSIAQIQSSLNGLSLDALFNGGAGDGFAKANFSGTLVALPIQLISFDAIKKETYVLVRWVTESEKDNDIYTVERSQNGVLFKNLTIVPGKGNGNSTQVYTTNDNDPLLGRSYYRLKWTDKDGISEYSKIRSVLFDQQDRKDFLLFPNPNDGNMVYVQMDGIHTNEKISVSLSDMQGKIFYQSEKPDITGNRIAINLSQKLAKGSYVVRVIRNNEPSAKVLIVQ